MVAAWWRHGGVIVALWWRHGGVVVASWWRHSGVMVALVYALKPVNHFPLRVDFVLLSVCAISLCIIPLTTVKRYLFIDFDVH